MSINHLLEPLGFSASETGVYEALLQYGTSTREQIASRTNLSPLSVAAAIESLLQRGAISSVRENDDQVFSAEAPDRLISLFEQQLDQYRLSLAKLKEQKQVLEGQMSGERPKVRFYQGKPGLFTIMQEFIDTSPNNALEMYSPEQTEAAFSDEEMKNQKRRRLSRNIYVKNIRFSNREVQNDVELTTNISVPLTEYPFFIDLTIYSNKVVIASVLNEPYGIVVESEEVAESFRTIFSLAELGANHLSDSK